VHVMIRYHYPTETCPNCTSLKIVSLHHRCKPSVNRGPARLLAFPKPARRAQQKPRAPRTRTGTIN
jgi:hypothetical protein